MRHPKVLGLRFTDKVKRQQRINFRVRYIEGDLVESERQELQAALDDVSKFVWEPGDLTISSRPGEEGK